MIRIKLSTGEVVYATFIKFYPFGKLVFYKEYLTMVDDNNEEVISMNIEKFVKPFYKPLKKEKK